MSMVGNVRSESAGDPPLDFIVRGGREIGNVDVGYGPARAFHSGEVQAITAALVRFRRRRWPSGTTQRR